MCDRNKQVSRENSDEQRAGSTPAERALAEAEERRRKAGEPVLPKELGGRKGPEPTRYGDWEKSGIASDF